MALVGRRGRHHVPGQPAAVGSEAAALARRALRGAVPHLVGRHARRRPHRRAGPHPVERYTFHGDHANREFVGIGAMVYAPSYEASRTTAHTVITDAHRAAMDMALQLAAVEYLGGREGLDLIAHRNACNQPKDHYGVLHRGRHRPRMRVLGGAVGRVHPAAGRPHGCFCPVCIRADPRLARGRGRVETRLATGAADIMRQRPVGQPPWTSEAVALARRATRHLSRTWSRGSACRSSCAGPLALAYTFHGVKPAGAHRRPSLRAVYSVERDRGAPRLRAPPRSPLPLPPPRPPQPAERTKPPLRRESSGVAVIPRPRGPGSSADPLAPHIIATPPSRHAH